MAAVRKYDRKGTRRDPAVWDALVNAQFDGHPVLSPAESLAAAAKLYRHALGKAPRKVELTSGRRYTWERHGVLSVNPDKRERHARGLRAIIHDISHYAHTRLHPNDAPHSIRQARLEAKLAKFAVARGWHAGTPVVKPKAEKAPAPIVETPKPDAVQLRYDRMVKRRDKWAAELERAKRLHAKAAAECRTYERRHKERLAK